MKKQKNGLTLNEAKPNCFEKTKVRWGIFKIFSSQKFNRSTKVVLAANLLIPATNLRIHNLKPKEK